MLPASTILLTNCLLLSTVMKSPGKRGKVKRCRRESEEVWHLDREEARVRRLSGREATSGCVLSERHPVAAGLMNTSVFVIIPHRQKGES